MLVPKLAALLGIAGVLSLLLSAVLGATSMADWILDAAQAFIVLAAVWFELWIFMHLVREGWRSAQAPISVPTDSAGRLA